MTEFQLRKKVCDIMQSWVGATRGSTRHKEILRIYNSYKPLPRGYAVQVGDAYCATTVSAAWIEANVASVAVIECSVPKMVSLAQARGIWVEDDKYSPNIGDAIVYDWEDGTNYASTDDKAYPDPVGIVVKNDDGKLWVVEGNMTGGKVGERAVNVNGRYIRGFICPQYYKLAEPEKTTRQIAMEVINGKWGVWPFRKSKLEAAGYDYDKVQAEVNRLLKSRVIYKVKAGDTLSQIAAWYCRTTPYTTNYQIIAQDNDIKNPNIIYKGQRLYLYAK